MAKPPGSWTLEAAERVAWGIAAASGILALASPLPVLLVLPSAVGLSAAALGARILRTRGHETAAGWLLVTICFAIVAAATCIGGGLHGPFAIGSAGAVLVSLLVLPAGPAWAAAAAGLSSIGLGHAFRFAPPLVVVKSPEESALWVSVVFVVAGGLIAVSGSRRAEQLRLQLQSQIQRYESVAESSFELVAELDENARYTYASPNHRQLLGYDAADLIGRSCLEYIHPEDKPKIASTLAVHAPGSEGGETFRFRHRSGQWVWFEAAGRNFSTPTGVAHAVVVARDLTERRRAEDADRRYRERLEREVSARTAELRSMQDRHVEALSMSAAEHLAGSVAHAINNPLAALRGTIELEAERSGPKPFLERIHLLAERIDRVVARTLTLFRRGRPELASIAPATLGENARGEVAALARSRDVRVELKAASELSKLRADATLLQSALVAVLENAIQASPAGGVVWLDIEALPGDGAVRFAVSDAGPGIPEELRRQVFEPFFTTKGGGTGLGLSIVRGVVRGHGGRVLLEDRPGGGARVVLELPVRPRS